MISFYHFYIFYLSRTETVVNFKRWSCSYAAAAPRKWDLKCNRQAETGRELPRTMWPYRKASWRKNRINFLREIGSLNFTAKERQIFSGSTRPRQVATQLRMKSCCSSFRFIFELIVLVLMIILPFSKRTLVNDPTPYFVPGLLCIFSVLNTTCLYCSSPLY